MLSDMDMMQNLTTLSTLQLNQKLCTSSSTFTVQPASGIVAAMRRGWYGEDRHANISRLQSLFSLAMLRCEVLELKGTDSALRARILRLCKDAVVGLECLTQTYREDVAIVSNLSVLKDNVLEFLERMNG